MCKAVIVNVYQRGAVVKVGRRYIVQGHERPSSFINNKYQNFENTYAAAHEIVTMARFLRKDWRIPLKTIVRQPRGCFCKQQPGLLVKQDRRRTTRRRRRRDDPARTRLTITWARLWSSRVDDIMMYGSYRYKKMQEVEGRPRSCWPFPQIDQTRDAQKVMAVA